MIEDGDYPNPVVEEQPDPIGDYNIPDEVDEMGGPHRQMTIGEADFDYVLDAVAYEAGETVELEVYRAQDGEYNAQKISVTLGAKKDAPSTNSSSNQQQNEKNNKY